MHTRTCILALLVALLLCLSCIGHGQSQALDQLGHVDFANSCRAAVQGLLQHGVAMLHSFWFGESEQTFRAVLAQEPACAIATWGIAAALMGNPLAGHGPSPQDTQRAQAAIAEGREIGAQTPREREYLDAVAAYYQAWETRPEPARQQARAQAFTALAARYPADDEAQIFAALYLAATQSRADHTYAPSLQAAAMLERQFARHPNHPGVAHYLIHCYDAPPLAAQGLPAARRYAAIAPGVPHALHMPSHIFIRVGAWAEAAATNARAVVAAQHANEPNDQLHAMDYLVYAYLQMARDGDARRVVADAARVPDASPGRVLFPYPLAAIPARYAIERGDWRHAMALTPPGSHVRFVEALTYFARALGAARNGAPEAAMRAVHQIEGLRDEITRAHNDDWTAEAEVTHLSAAAWATWAQGQPEEALRLMRHAADLEDERQFMTPGRLVPARELLGELLLALQRPAEALTAFEASQQRAPERFRSLYGSAQAAVHSNDIAQAKRYFARLVEMASQGDERPELAQARAFLAAHP
jgi:tetratricopeptide (TPR) repeat protein